ncbi:hypothetical protein MesoLj131c_63640 [Mesorhizobium sp. 131-3-5]|uniref:winged helix domain-containing protein n=1 Tax=Mesorhizobium sp. 131-3-5 TaxID=2744520 RepID=UPI0019264424|nr:hypothetical protein [Mesorhizobium sp. 131-3-5]BCH12106.1 hypothetical protein MesoLj131c_63640 [Mesorhizobium sp. 131-3-5]
MQHVADARAPVNSRIDEANKKFAITFRKSGKGARRDEVPSFAGREAWELRELIQAGEAGCTPIDNPAPRWSHYVWLHRDTFSIATVMGHSGPLAGLHAKYVPSRRCLYHRRFGGLMGAAKVATSGAVQSSHPAPKPSQTQGPGAAIVIGLPEHLSETRNHNEKPSGFSDLAITEAAKWLAAESADGSKAVISQLQGRFALPFKDAVEACLQAALIRARSH